MTHIEPTPHRISICVDCLAFLANGTTGDSPDAKDDAEHAADMAREWGVGTEITLGRMRELDESEEDFETDAEDGHHDGFSWHPCQGCGSTLGGDRYAATAWF